LNRPAGFALERTHEITAYNNGRSSTLFTDWPWNAAVGHPYDHDFAAVLAEDFLAQADAGRTIGTKPEFRGIDARHNR
jgi:hypothetical protein